MNQKDKSATTSTFFEHLLEARRRIFYVFLAFIGGTILGFVYNSVVEGFLISPLGQQLFYTSPMGGFNFLFQTSLFVGTLLAIPVVIINIIKFIEPTIGKNKSLFALKILIASLMLVGVGISFAYNVSLPPTLGFLTGFNSENIGSLISTTEYLSFIKLYLTAFALIFQIPLVLLIINNITPINPQKMLKAQKYVIVASFIAAAIISPTPDALNQVLMAGPMILLYELSILLIWLQNKHKDKHNLDKQLNMSTAYDDLISSEPLAPPIPKIDSKKPTTMLSTNQSMDVVTSQSTTNLAPKRPPKKNVFVTAESEQPTENEKQQPPPLDRPTRYKRSKRYSKRTIYNQPRAYISELTQGSTVSAI